MNADQFARLSDGQLHRLDAVRNPKAAPFEFKLVNGAASVLVAKRSIFQGLIARGETSAWIGPPGSLKSALLAEMSTCAGNGQDWHGKRSKGRVGVVYFALERADLVHRRLEAHRQRLNLTELPIAVVSKIINLMNDKSAVGRVVATIREAEVCFNLPVGLVIFDTFAKLIAAGGGDEDKAKDQGAVFANVQRIKDQVDVHIAVAGHTGKDQSRGARGSSAFLGDADVMVAISGDMTRTATIIKANDMPEGPLFSFRSDVHEFGVDEDGDSISVNVISGDHCDVVGSPSRAQQVGRLPKAAQTALRALAEAIDEQGAAPPASLHIPPSTKTVSLTTWRQQAYRRGISASEEERARQQAFKRAFEFLVGASRVGHWDGQIWLAS